MCQRHNGLDWAKFINDELVDREEYELALATCESCLRDYLHLLEQDLESPSPDFTAKVMAGLESAQGKGLRQGRYNSLKPLFHYLVAACLTLVFFELGVFDLIPKISEGALMETSLISTMLARLEELLGALTN